MKLYKYVSMATAQKILAESTIGFSKPNYFNDPFDQPVAIPLPTANPIDGLFAHVGAQAKSWAWRKNTAILSLTRTATNPLMWAHYADAHRGAVLAIDTEVAGLTDPSSNMVPAHFGSVVYVRNLNMGPYYSDFKVGVTVGETHHFVIEHYEKWQRLFLTKSLDWAYEEEVRVVKCIRGVHGADCETQSGRFNVVARDGHELHAFHIPPAAIVGVTLGMRTSGGDLAALRTSRPDITFNEARMCAASYAIMLHPI